MKETKTIFFDYGGTLDTGGHHWGRVIWDAYEAFLPHVNYEAYRKAYVATERLLGNEPIIKPDTTFKEVLREKINRQIDFLASMKKEGKTVGLFEEKEAKEKAPVIADYLYKSTKEIVESSRRTLIELRKKHKLALVSNFYGNLSTVISEFSLDNLFDTVVESAAVGIRKPDVEIYRLALTRMETTPDKAVVVGDSIKNDILPAHTLGCTTVWIKGKSWSETQENEPCANVVIEKIDELLKPEIEKTILGIDC